MCMDQKLQELRMTPIEHGVVTDVQLVEAGAPASFPGLPIGPAPEHIKVCVTCKPEAGSNIRIEVWLPTNSWNGDLVGVGNGGAAGHILPFVMVGPLRLGFAVTTTDMGTSAGPDCGIGNKAVWRDFGYRATHLMTLAAKAIVESFYGAPPKHSYFTGSSTGGQQALMEAQRYPEDYDGILASAPAWDRVNLHLGFLWDWMALNKGEAALFTKDDADKIVKTILDHCGTEGGRRPGDDFMYHPHKIVMSPNVLADAGLSNQQIEALMKIYQGLTDPSTGERIYEPTMMPGSEACDMGLTHRCEHPGFAEGMFYIFRWVLGKDFDFTAFDFQEHGKKVHEELDSYLNATSADLSAFRARGGKLLLIHGTADPIIPYTSSIRYYEQVCKELGAVDSFFRLFLAPGMAHTTGGPGVQDIVFGLPATPKDSKHLGLLALKDWVETGIAPEALHPVAFKADNPISAFMPDGMAFEREVHPYTGE